MVEIAKMIAIISSSENCSFGFRTAAIHFAFIDIKTSSGITDGALDVILAILTTSVFLACVATVSLHSLPHRILEVPSCQSRAIFVATLASR